MPRDADLEELIHEALADVAGVTENPCSEDGPSCSMAISFVARVKEVSCCA